MLLMLIIYFLFYGYYIHNYFASDKKCHYPARLHQSKGNLCGRWPQSALGSAFESEQRHCPADIGPSHKGALGRWYQFERHRYLYFDKFDKFRTKTPSCHKRYNNHWHLLR